MPLGLATLAALSLALPDAPIRPELGVAVSPDVALPRGLGLVGKVDYDRFGVGGNLTMVEGTASPFWSAWASVEAVGPLRVFGGAVTTAGFPLCPDFGPCSPLPVAGAVLPFAGVAFRKTVGPTWFELGPSLLVAGSGMFSPYGLVNAFIAGPPLLALGWQVTPNLSVSLRAGMLPLAVAYGF